MTPFHAIPVVKCSIDIGFLERNSKANTEVVKALMSKGGIITLLPFLGHKDGKNIDELLNIWLLDYDSVVHAGKNRVDVT